MHRFIAAMFAALLLLPAQAVGKTTRIPPHHLTLAPGASVDIPDGWMACDPKSNVALHNAPHIIAIEAFCNSVNQNAQKSNFPIEEHVFIDSDPSTKLTMGFFANSMYFIPEEYFSKATPKLLEEINDLYCKHVIAHTGFPIGSCTLRATSFGGRPALVGETETKPGPHGQFIGRVYIFTGPTGTMVFVFAAQAPVTAKVRAVMDLVASSMSVAPPAPEVVGELIPLKPLAGMTLSVPKGWASCNAALDGVLGHPPDPLEIKSRACSGMDPTGDDVRLYDPRPPHVETVEVTSMDADVQVMADKTSPEGIARDHDQDCAEFAGSTSKDGLTFGDCQSAAGTFAGRPAKIVTYSAGGRPDPNQLSDNIKTRVIFVPVGKRLFIVSLTVESALTPDFDATCEAVLNSAAFQ